MRNSGLILYARANKKRYHSSENMKYDELIQKFLNPQVFEYIEAANKLIEYIILSNQTIEGGTTIGNEHLWPIIDNKILTIYAHESCLSLDDSTPVSKD